MCTNPLSLQKFRTNRLLTGLLLGLFLGLTAFGTEINGRVVDAVSGKGLTGANITIPSMGVGTATNTEGYFILVGDFADTCQVCITHVGYVTYNLTVAELHGLKLIALEPQPIPFKGVEIRGELKKYALDLPTDVKIITQDLIRSQAPIDLGDLLRGEAGLQIQSSSPINQTISIRGSNADQVLILYDGLPIQSSRDAIGDLSWINIQDIGELQVIKGSQTTVFGEGGIGGVVNIESPSESPYSITLNGRMGSHAFQETYLGLSKPIGNFFNRYSWSKRRLHYDNTAYDSPLDLAASYHNLVGGYRTTQNELLLRGLRMLRNLEKDGSPDATNEERALASLRYRGNLGKSPDWLSHIYYRNFLTTERYLTAGAPHQPQTRLITNRYRDEVLGWRGEKSLSWADWLIQLGGEYQHSYFASRTLWDFTGPSIVDSLRFIQNLTRYHHAFYTVVKHHATTGLAYLPWIDWNWSTRYDQALTDRYYLAASEMYPEPKTGKTRYRCLNYKLGLEMGGSHGTNSYSLFVTNGANSRFPALYDLYLNDVTVSPIYQDSTVAPEKVNTTEIGVSWDRQITSAASAFRALKVKTTYFRNDFSDKIYYKPFVYSTPVTLNATAAQISGWEFNAVLEMRLPVTINLGAQILDISDETLFPNKPDVKYQAELTINQGNFTLRLRGFYEGQEMAAATLPGGIVKLQTMQARQDVDFSVAYKYSRKHYDIWLSLTALNAFTATDAGLQPDYYDRSRLIQVNLGLGLK
jgi:hypothetical protein